MLEYEWNLLKISFTNTYFQGFPGFLALKETVAHVQPKGQFWPVFGKIAKTVKIIKKVHGTFFSLLHALTNCKVSEKVMNGFPENA